MYKNINIEDQGRVRTITITTGSALNPLSIEVLSEIKYGIESSEERVVVLTGSAKAFSAGANVKDFKDLTPPQAFEFARQGHDVMDYIASYSMPVIAAMHGFALGGGFELALACDIRIAKPGTVIGLPEITLGILPGFGGTQRLKALIGEARAFDMIANGKRIVASDALAMGIVNEVSEDYLGRAKEYARDLADKPRLSLELIKQLLRTKSDNVFKEEQEAFGKVFESLDSKEGVDAFLEKRKPVFTGTKR